MDVDGVTDDLYRLHPSEFVEARDARAKDARAAGDKVFGSQVAKLKRPTLSAWALNLLARERPEDLEQLLHVGRLLRDAQNSLAGDELRSLGTQRRRIVATITADARDLARRAGHPIADQVGEEISRTLDAAMSDPATAEALLSGRLTAAASPVRGFGDVVIAAKPHLQLVKPPHDLEPNASTAAIDRRAERLAAERLEARQRELDAAEQELRSRSEEVKVAQRHADEMFDRLEQALAVVDRLARELDDARALASSAAEHEREGRAEVTRSAAAEMAAKSRLTSTKQSLHELRST